MNPREIVQPIRGEMITLGQLVKLLSLISSGAQIKDFLAETPITVNGEPESRRGRKLYDGDIIAIPDYGSVRIKAEP